MAIHINIFGAPGSGKSTSRARLFYDMKKLGYKVEEISEMAKDYTYAEEFMKLGDQVYLLGQQHHKHFVLDNQVDYIITDSPFIMGSMYMNQNSPYLNEFEKLAVQMHKSYETLNFFIERNHDYQTFGRNQTEEQSDEKADEIKNFLNKYNIDYITVKSGEPFIKNALKLIQK